MKSAAEKPDASLFSKDEKPGEFQARFRIEGEVSITIKADSVEEARAKAMMLCDQEEFGNELDEVTDVRVGSVYKTPTMYRITRDGKKMQASYLRAGDEPREPDGFGF